MIINITKDISILINSTTVDMSILRAITEFDNKVNFSHDSSVKVSVEDEEAINILRKASEYKANKKVKLQPQHKDRRNGKKKRDANGNCLNSDGTVRKQRVLNIKTPKYTSHAYEFKKDRIKALEFIKAFYSFDDIIRTNTCLSYDMKIKKMGYFCQYCIGRWKIQPQEIGIDRWPVIGDGIGGYDVAKRGKAFIENHSVPIEVKPEEI